MLYDIISSKMFYFLPCIMWLVTMLSDVTYYVTVWFHHSNPNPSSKNRIKENKLERKIKIQKENRKRLSLLLVILTLPPFQGFSSRETNFHFCQFLSNFLKYSFSNFLSSHLYNIFVVYLSSSSLFLKFFSSIISNFSYLLTLALILLSNSSIASLVFSKSFSLS